MGVANTGGHPDGGWPQKVARMVNEASPDSSVLGPAAEPSIGPLLRDLRERSGRSQAQQAALLSQLSGRPVTRNEVSRWENEARLLTPFWQRHAAATFGTDAAKLARAVQIARMTRRRSRYGVESVSQAISDSPRVSGVDRTDLVIMQEMTSTFRRLDNRFGGGHNRLMLESYISVQVEPALNSRRVSDSLRRDLFLAVAELYQIAGWMAYDMADRMTGRRWLQAALRICEDATTDSLMAEILAAMSHQASFNGSSDSAVELAMAAGHAARRAGLPKLQAEAAAMEAHGLGLQRDTQGCIKALTRAERHFHGTENSQTPEWLTYFDDAYLAAKFSHALRALGQLNEAERFARQSLDMIEGYDRGRMFNTSLLAGILADQARVDEAVTHAGRAVEMGKSIRSARAQYYLNDVFRRLRPYDKTAAVESLKQTVGTVDPQQSF